MYFVDSSLINTQVLVLIAAGGVVAVAVVAMTSMYVAHTYFAQNR